MKRFVFPALFCIDAPTQEEAEALAGQMQTGAREALPLSRQGAALCILDETLPTVEIPIKEDEDPPHSYVDVMGNALFTGLN